MGIPLDQLPAHVRAQVLAQAGSRAKRPRGSKQGVAEDDEGGACPYRCRSCGGEFPSYGGKAGWAVHSRDTGHSIGAMVLPGVPGQANDGTTSPTAGSTSHS